MTKPNENEGIMLDAELINKWTTVTLTEITDNGGDNVFEHWTDSGRRRWSLLRLSGHL